MIGCPRQVLCASRKVYYYQSIICPLIDCCAQDRKWRQNQTNIQPTSPLHTTKGRRVYTPSHTSTELLVLRILAFAKRRPQQTKNYIQHTSSAGCRHSFIHTKPTHLVHFFLVKVQSLGGVKAGLALRTNERVQGVLHANGKVGTRQWERGGWGVILSCFALCLSEGSSGR